MDPRWLPLWQSPLSLRLRLHSFYTQESEEEVRTHIPPVPGLRLAVVFTVPLQFRVPGTFPGYSLPPFVCFTVWNFYRGQHGRKRGTSAPTEDSQSLVIHQQARCDPDIYESAL